MHIPHASRIPGCWNMMRTCHNSAQGARVEIKEASQLQRIWFWTLECSCDLYRDPSQAAFGAPRVITQQGDTDTSGDDRPHESIITITIKKYIFFKCSGWYRYLAFTQSDLQLWLNMILIGCKLRASAQGARKLVYCLSIELFNYSFITQVYFTLTKLSESLTCLTCYLFACFWTVGKKTVVNPHRHWEKIINVVCVH